MLVPETVRRSTAAVMERATEVRIDDVACRELAGRIAAEPEAADWDASDHYRGEQRATLHYLLVVDALNFCFWPDVGYEYTQLARSLRDVLHADSTAFDAEALATIDRERLASWLGRPLALLDERTRLLREVGTVLGAEFGGEAARLVAAAEGSAARLATLTARHLPGFRDHAIHDGRQVFLYKRAQIFAADVWGAFGGVDAGAFDDIGGLTTFADYRLPQLLRAEGVLRLSDTLHTAIEAGVEIPAGSRAEVEMRSATVQSVEALRDALSALGHGRSAVEVDWWLWHHAEAAAEALPPHHRTLSIFY